MKVKSLINSLSSFPMLQRKKSITGLLLAPLLLLPTLSCADDDAVKLLNKMNQALHELTYKGTLVLVQGNTVSSLLVDHSVVNGIRSERVVRLNESGSEVSRELKGFSLAGMPRIRPEMEKVYSFDLGRQNRVANIPCRIITARPKDRERYLQKYCIDTVTGMLLDYMLVGKSHKPVEQFMFTTIDIKVPEEMSQSFPADNPNCANDNSCNSVMPVSTANSTTAILDQSVTSVTPVAKKDNGADSLLRQISNASLEDGWIMEALPAGFEIRQAPHMKEVGTNPNIQGENIVTKHYIVSDGLSSLSLFVSPLSSNQLSSPSAVKVNSGALNVVTQEKGGHRITVVGEVPELTLKNIVKNLRKKN